MFIYTPVFAKPHIPSLSQVSDPSHSPAPSSAPLLPLGTSTFGNKTPEPCKPSPDFHPSPIFLAPRFTSFALSQLPSLLPAGIHCFPRLLSALLGLELSLFAVSITRTCLFDWRIGCSGAP